MAVYLIHFDQPYEHAKHYIGFADSLSARWTHHRGGTGARLLAVLRSAGIGWRVARVWPEADRTFERSLKSHSGTRYCPICRGPVAYRSKPRWSRVREGRKP